MVQVTDFKKKESKDGREFLLLKLTGDLSIVQSSKGTWYAATPSCYIPSSFEENVAKSLIGKQLPGSIVRVPTEPYDITNEETGEVMTLAFRWGYQPEGSLSPIM